MLSRIIPDQATLVLAFDIRHSASSAANAAVVLSAFALTIIILLIGASDLRKDPLSSFIVRPFMLAFIGNMLAAFQFMIVESDVTLTERTFAMILPPELLTMISTIMMLFGIILAVVRYFPDREVLHLSLWLFFVVGLYTLGLTHRTIADLYHVHELDEAVPISHLMRRIAVLVWTPALLMVAAHILVSHLKVSVKRLHSWNLWWSSIAMILAVLLFGVASTIKTSNPLHDRLLPIVAAGSVITLWLVLGACFYLLRHCDELWVHYPLPEGMAAPVEL